MANLKEIKTRIVSVKKTRQITQAMKLVAAAKLKRATTAATAAKPYQEELRSVLTRVAGSAGDELENPLLQSRPEVKRAEVVMLTSDRGMCGGFNNILLRNSIFWFQEKADEGTECSRTVFGRKGVSFLNGRDFDIQNKVVNYGKSAKMDLVRPLCDRLVSDFVDGKADEVWLVYNEFVNNMTQTPKYLKLLPLAVEDTDGGEESADYRYEPGAEAILTELLPLYVRTLVLQAFLETEAGEFAARMSAMDNATRNASDLIDNLTLEYNRARQAAITTQIIEIVSGAEAL
jgi:F-type H+-transporting ATPase subunit gamma